MSESRKGRNFKKPGVLGVEGMNAKLAYSTNNGMANLGIFFGGEIGKEVLRCAGKQRQAVKRSAEQLKMSRL